MQGKNKNKHTNKNKQQNKQSLAQTLNPKELIKKLKHYINKELSNEQATKELLNEQALVEETQTILNLGQDTAQGFLNTEIVTVDSLTFKPLCLALYHKKYEFALLLLKYDFNPLEALGKTDACVTPENIYKALSPSWEKTYFDKISEVPITAFFIAVSNYIQLPEKEKTQVEPKLLSVIAQLAEKTKDLLSEKEIADADSVQNMKNIMNVAQLIRAHLDTKINAARIEKAELSQRAKPIPKALLNPVLSYNADEEKDPCAKIVYKILGDVIRNNSKTLPFQGSTKINQFFCTKAIIGNTYTKDLLNKLLHTEELYKKKDKGIATEEELKQIDEMREQLPDIQKMLETVQGIPNQAEKIANLQHCLALGLIPTDNQNQPKESKNANASTPEKLNLQPLTPILTQLQLKQKLTLQLEKQEQKLTLAPKQKQTLHLEKQMQTLHLQEINNDLEESKTQDYTIMGKGSDDFTHNN